MNKRNVRGLGRVFLKEWVNIIDTEKTKSCTISWFFIYLYGGTFVIGRQSVALRCFSAMLPEVRPDSNFTIQICDPFSTLRFTRGVGYTGWAAVCFAVFSHVRSQPVCAGGDGWVFFQVLTRSLPRGSAIAEWPARSEISVSHTTLLFFHGGSLVFFCLPEVLVTSLMIRRVIRKLFSKC